MLLPPAELCVCVCVFVCVFVRSCRSSTYSSSWRSLGGAATIAPQPNKQTNKQTNTHNGLDVRSLARRPQPRPSLCARTRRTQVRGHEPQAARGRGPVVHPRPIPRVSAVGRCDPRAGRAIACWFRRPRATLQWSVTVPWLRPSWGPSAAGD